MKQEYTKYLKIKSKSKYILFLVLYFLLYPICKLIYGRRNNWIICERADEAQDNGFIFYKYLRENHPEINAIYLIDKKTKQFKNVKDLGKTVQFGSLKHLLLLIGCRVKISSQLFGYAPWVQFLQYYRRNKTKDVHVFLQHGITKNDHEGLHSQTCRSLKLFVCGAKPEYEFINESFHYRNSVPQYTGFARYDLLMNPIIKKQIILMPTWRAELVDLGGEEFKKTSFYNEWLSLMKNKYLIDYCRDNDITIKFYLHHSLKKFAHVFGNIPNIKTVNFGEESVQNILKESMMLITDFSSVYFDFAYMKKPLIYFQFDEDTFYEQHYAKGYFDYRRDGFGDVCLTVDAVVNSFKRIVESDFNVEQKYVDRIKNNFVYHDSDNCNRIFDAIQRCLK